MLKVIWTPSAAIAPGNPGFDETEDLLSVVTAQGPQVVARIRRDGSPVDLTALSQAVGGWIDGGPRTAPIDYVSLLVHGFQFDPSAGSPKDDPFNLVYGIPGNPASETRPDPRLSWLPIVGEVDEAGTDAGRNAAIAFAWVSQERHSFEFAKVGWNNPYLYAAFDLAPLAARALAFVIQVLQARGQRTRILAHSLGTRATCQAIGALPSGMALDCLERVVLLGGAEYTVDANRNIVSRGLPAVFNVANRRDAVLTYLAHQFSAPVRMVGTNSNRVIGAGGLKPALPGWLDLQLDRPDAVAWLGAHGFSVRSEALSGDGAIHTAAGLNHWVYYMAEGNRRLVRFLLSDPDASVSWFRQHGFPEGVVSSTYGVFDPTVPETPGSYAERMALYKSDHEPGGA